LVIEDEYGFDHFRATGFFFIRVADKNSS